MCLLYYFNSAKTFLDENISLNHPYYTFCDRIFQGDKVKKISTKRWLVVTMLFGMFANIAHPVTPRFIKLLGLGDSMFGYAFAGMAITNFLFSPMWARIAQKYGSVKVTLVTLFFYAVSQLMFGLSTTVFSIMFARLFGGFFIGGLFVAQLLYIVNHALPEEKGRAMVNNATMQIVFGTFGYLVGGLIGDFSIIGAFYFQVIGLLLTATFVLLFIKDDSTLYSSKRFNFKEINPFRSLQSDEIRSNRLIRNVFIVSVLASTATVLYDQSFNYYMADFFNFPPSVNGTVKAITGILAFITNSTLTLWIIKKTNLIKSLGAIFLTAATLILTLINIEIPLIFLIVNITYFAVHAAYTPIMQNLVTDTAKDQTGAIGTLNSLKSLGMIVGAIVAGITYAIDKKFPFVISIVIYAIAGFISFKLVSVKKEKTLKN